MTGSKNARPSASTQTVNARKSKTPQRKKQTSALTIVGTTATAPVCGGTSALSKSGKTSTTRKGARGVDRLVSAIGSGRKSPPHPEVAPASNTIQVNPDTRKVRERAGAKREGGKLGALIALMRRTQGATIEQMIETSGWQAHSVRGAISGAIKKRLGLDVRSETSSGSRVYHIVAKA